MATGNDYLDNPCDQGVCRRDFVKLAVMASLLAGCSIDLKSAAMGNNETTGKSTAVPAYSADDFSRMAYCGINCRAACPEHEYPSSCSGCKSDGEKLGHYCKVCSIRKCADNKQILTCAHCDGYPSCEVDTWEKYPILREMIDRIRSDLL